MSRLMACLAVGLGLALFCWPVTNAQPVGASESLGCWSGSAKRWVADQPCRPPLSERQRYGFVATLADWPQRFDVAQLLAGWYLDFRSSSVPPDVAAMPMDRALVMRTNTGYALNPATLDPLVDSNPGALWLIGNEPDCVWQDNVLPEEYARIYHDLYVFIKSRDQSSQIAAGGIVQPTPLRLEYLDRVLAAYRARYGRPMPVDLWHIHNAILNEVSCEYDPSSCWGAGIPPGIEAPYGAIRSVQDNDDIGIFAGQIWAFRRWMAERGYTGYPLVVSEYGVLMPESYGFGQSRVNTFMSSTFDILSNTSDTSLGDPADEYRLVQRWAWFSLDVQPWNPITGEGFNGNLFDPASNDITTFGLQYASHTASFPPLAYVDLGFAEWDAPSAPCVVSPTEAISYSLGTRILNRGTLDVPPGRHFSVTLSYEGPVSGALAQTVAGLPAVSSQWLTFTLTNLPPGGYLLSLEIDPYGQVDDITACNNLATRTIIVPRHALHLPLVLSGRADPCRRAAAYPDAGASECGAAGCGIESLSAGRVFGSIPQAAPAATLEFEMPTAASYPAQLALDPLRQVLWITERDGNKIACFELQGMHWCQPAEYMIDTADSQLWGLAVDGDGNVWFAEPAADKIGKVDVGSGVITESVPLTPGSQPWAVAIAGDGMVWFTEKAGNRIGKLNPATGQVIEYGVLVPEGSQPSGIAIHGNAVWFTQTAADQFGWFINGTVWPPVPVKRPAGSQPQDIVTASVTSAWFTEMGGNQIVLFVPQTSGWFTEVKINTPGSEPYGIAMESDDAVWFTERAGNKLGRYTGQFPHPSEYSLPTPDSLPTDIVVDRDGCAWYTAPGVNRIGRFCPRSNDHTYLPLVLRSQPSISGK
jgi:streptogramin lyase